IQLIVSEITDKTIKYDFNFINDDKQLLAKGSVIVVCVTFSETGMKSTTIPHSIRNRINTVTKQS
ncbi:hypothetical protein OAG39_03135, partial [Verrucomicrobiales bacterium]|nr:hypothetical protein [Verrucomicrobiales bacterium]